nr:C10 family peptidase [Prolixibacteraceae bacterium]
MKQLVVFRYVLFFGLIFFPALWAYPAPIDRVRAEKVAVNWLAAISDLSFTEKNVSSVQVIEHQGLPLYYLVTFHPQGWAIVSGSDQSEPVLAYARDGFLPLHDMPAPVKEWLQAKENELKGLIEEGIQPSGEIRNRWQNLSADTPLPASLPEALSVSASPLLSTTWNQGRYYNEMCPADPASTTGNGRVWLGCVATSMAQVMKYWEYPYSGLGNHSYMHSDYGVQSANFENAEYIWSAMPPNVTSLNAEVQEIGYHCAVSVDMDFGPGSSGAWLEDAEAAMKTYFRYNATTFISDRDRWSSSDWETLLRNEIDNGRPIIYSGYNQSGSSGHAWVCDGYSGSYFHFNWGWSGSGDGNYLLTDLTPLSHNFTYRQSALLGIEPVSLSFIEMPYIQGFEDSYSPFSLFGEYGFPAGFAHTGSHALKLGRETGNSSVRNAATVCFMVPDDAELNFWVNRFTPQVSTQNQQKALLLPQFGETPLAEIFNGDFNDGGWVNYSFDLSVYAGQIVRLVFFQDNNDFSKNQWMYIDDLSITGIYVNLPPFTPAHPVPPDECPNASLTPTLAWSGGDPNGDALSYSVYLGNTNPPPLAGIVTGTSFYAGTLPHSTRHFWKVVASDGEHSAPGPVWSFTTDGIPPDMGVCGISELTSISASVCGEVLNDNGALIDSRGICWSNKPDPTTNNSVVYPENQQNVYTCSLEGLSPFQTYYYRAFALSDEGTGYSETASFTTLPALPVVEWIGFDQMLRSSIRIEGKVQGINDETIFERGVVWSAESGFDPALAQTTSESGNWPNPGNFQIRVNGLPGPGPFFFRIFARNGVGAAYSGEVKVETENTPPHIDLDANNSSGALGVNYNGTCTEQEGEGRIADEDLVLFDADGDPIREASLILRNQFYDDKEYLCFPDVYPFLQVTGNETDHLVLTSNGDLSVETWVDILRSVSVWNGSDAPHPERIRSVEVRLNDGFDLSNPAVAMITQIPVNDPPVCMSLPLLDSDPAAFSVIRAQHAEWDDPLDECPAEVTRLWQWQYLGSSGETIDLEGETSDSLFLGESLCGHSIRVLEKVADGFCGGILPVFSEATSAWVEINRKQQSLDFDVIPVHYMHEPFFTLGGESSSGLPVLYHTVNENVIRISQDTAYPVGVGRVVVVGSQPGNQCYLP